MDKFRNKYRIQSHRMPNWDYAGSGYYFITIVTQNRECNLGNIVNTSMILSDFGKIVENEWYKSFEIRSELFLDEFILMPNHLHAIIILEKIKNEKTTNMNGLHGTHGTGTHGTHVETHGRASLQSPEQSIKQSIKPSIEQSTEPIFIRKPKSISSFIAGFKSAIYSKIDDYIDENNLNIPKYNRNNHFFQPNYHDHIIRNNAEYKRIKNYIINNPLNWDKDKFYNE
jgi:REP element-mobilizing transposase RayT